MLKFEQEFCTNKAIFKADSNFIVSANNDKTVRMMTSCTTFSIFFCSLVVQGRPKHSKCTTM